MTNTESYHLMMLVQKTPYHLIDAIRNEKDDLIIIINHLEPTRSKDGCKISKRVPTHYIVPKEQAHNFVTMLQLKTLYNQGENK